MARKKALAADGDLAKHIQGFNGLTSHFHVQSKRLTDKQKSFLDLSLYSALRFLSTNIDLDLFYVRTVVESGERNLGSLPGDVDEKFNPYMAPLDDKLREMVKPSIIPELIQKRRIEAMPINYLRGASWENKIVIADEAQNFTFKELTTLITRIGENTKLFVCGDFLQSDINGKTGFRKMFDLFDDEISKTKGIHTFEFTKKDIKRSKILGYIIEKIEKVVVA